MFLCLYFYRFISAVKYNAPPMLSDFVRYIPLSSFVERPEQHRWPQGSMYTIYQVPNTISW